MQSQSHLITVKPIHNSFHLPLYPKLVLSLVNIIQVIIYISRFSWEFVLFFVNILFIYSFFCLKEFEFFSCFLVNKLLYVAIVVNV